MILSIQAKRNLSGNLVGDISEKKSISGNVSIGNTLVVTHKEFEGPYEVKPLTESQTLSTKDKLMTDDLVVLSIPYAEVTNLANGITVTIGE